MGFYEDGTEAREKRLQSINLCTDGYEGYGYYQLSKRHVVSKSETALLESKNSLIRLSLARFNRKTRRFSKALDVMFFSLIILFHKSILMDILI